LTYLTPLQKEEIGRLWCSKENNNIKLNKEQIWFWDNSDKMYLFEFDITSNPQRKEIEELQEKIKKYERQHGVINDKLSHPYVIELIGMYDHSPDKPDNIEVIGMVKSGKHSNGGNTYHSILGDCFLLTKAKADKKCMILTDKEMYDYFQGRCKAILDEIELVYLNPNEHRYLLDNLS